MPRRVLARGRRPRRRRGARHAAAGRGVLADGGLLRPHARHAPRLQQRVHEHAARRGEREVPRGRSRTRSSSTREILKRFVNFMNNPDEETAVDQFGKGDKYFGVCDADGDDARAADVRPRPDRGLRREVRHGVPPRVLGRDARPRARRAPRARDLPAAAPALRSSPGSTTSRSTTSSPTTARSTRTSSRTRTGAAASGRWSSTTTATPSTRGWIRESVPFAERARGGSGRGEAAAAANARRRARPHGRGRLVRDPARPAGRARVPARRRASWRTAACAWTWVPTTAGCSSTSIEVVDAPGRPYGRLAGELGGRGVPSVEEAMRAILLRPVREPVERAARARGDGVVAGDGRAARAATARKGTCARTSRRTSRTCSTRRPGFVGGDGVKPDAATAKVEARLAAGIRRVDPADVEDDADLVALVAHLVTSSLPLGLGTANCRRRPRGRPAWSGNGSTPGASTRSSPRRSGAPASTRRARGAPWTW